MEPRHAKVLTPAKFRHLLRVTEATSRFPERDTLILLLGVTCGMRVTEIARLEVTHALTRSGARREEIALPGSITKGCRPRCVFLSHPRALEAFDRYVEWRYIRADGVLLDKCEYRGLMPHTRLILTQKGGPFELSVKRRGQYRRRSCRVSGCRQPAELRDESVPRRRPRSRVQQPFREKNVC